MNTKSENILTRRTGARKMGARRPSAFIFSVSPDEDEYILRASMSVQPQISKAEFCRIRIFHPGWKLELDRMRMIKK
jgi:hypothetical protein